jgi:signal transduction histidine kinase
MAVVMAANSAGEFAAMLDVEKLNRQKQDLELRSTAQRYRYIRNVVILLIICLSAVLLMLARWYRLGRRLARSREELLVKNDALIESRAEAMAAREQAELASGMKSVFLRNITHEIRTPLNAIVGFSHLIAEASSPESDIHQYADIIKDNNALLLKLIEQVLDLSDLDSGRTLKLVPTDIDECCKNAIARAGVCLKPGVEMEMIPYRKPLKALANGERVEQILHNLLQNACEATAEGKVTLACKLLKESSQIVFTVTDTGTGIPADMREEIFDRFVKLDEFKLGSGLGLSLSRLLAKHMGGSLVVDENYVGGARFVFTLPYSADLQE